MCTPKWVLLLSLIFAKSCEDVFPKQPISTRKEFLFFFLQKNTRLMAAACEVYW
jgi:hypothetical protein